MKITEVTVGLTTSVNIAPYEYAKPELSLTATVEENETPEEVIGKLKELVGKELTKTCEILKAQK